MPSKLITISEPDIELYKEGFREHCRLGRASEGKKLSELVEEFSHPLSIALDAPWGAGKSVFLKCWVGAHKSENGGTANTVYFDAFRNDFMDDPLVGLTAAVSNRFEAGSPKEKIWGKAKNAAFMFSRPALRIGMAIATEGASMAVGALAKAATASSAEELERASDEFWKREDGKRAAMAAFRTALQELTEETKLVIVVDELDRCRPDYALNLLEVIKHFFDVPNVHFVLGVNLQELANSVRARYGSEIAAERYLQKFVSVTMPLMPKPRLHASQKDQLLHFRTVAAETSLRDDWKYNWIEEYLTVVDHHARLSLRDVEQIITLSLATPSPRSGVEAAMHFYVGLLILKILNPQAVEKARNGTLSKEDVFSVLNVHDQERHANAAHREMHEVWRLATSEQISSEPEYLRNASKKLFDGISPKKLLQKVISETLDVFQITF